MPLQLFTTAELNMCWRGVVSAYLVDQSLDDGDPRQCQTALQDKCC